MDVRQLAAAEVDDLAPRLLELQRRAYEIEAHLIGDDRIPPLHESLDDLRSTGLSWLIAGDDSRIVGALGFRLDSDTVDIDRLVVDPAYHRRGVGRALVLAALARGRRVLVATGRANAPARRLYEALGFVHLGDREVLDGLWLSEYAIDNSVNTS